MKITKTVNRMVSKKDAEYAEADPIGPSDADNSKLESDVTDLEPTEDDLTVDYPEDVTAETGDGLDLLLTKDSKVLLKKISKDNETLIDALMAHNENKDFSRLIKMLQTAVRLADELLLSDDTLSKGK